MGDLRPGWKRVKFGDVVRLNKDRSKDPEADGLERYVGLEHIEPDDLRVRSWGDVSEGTTFTNRFRPGQVLFGKRRAYQRKVAVAAFEGVCSGDIYVLEPKDPDALVPELLPFICQTDAFFEHAVGTSAGSLSPRTNWKSLSAFSFLLPPIHDQRGLVKLMALSESSANEADESALTAGQLSAAVLMATFGHAQKSVPLQTLCDDPITYGIVQAGPDLPDGVPYVRVTEMTETERLDPSAMMRTSTEISAAYSRTILDEGDIVVALRGVAGLAHRVPKELAGGNLSRGVARVAPRSDVNRDYVYWAMRSPQFQRDVIRYANGWKGEALREITIGALRELPLPWLPQVEQAQVVARTEEVHEAAMVARNRARAARQLHFKLVNSVLAGQG